MDTNLIRWTRTLSDVTDRRTNNLGRLGGPFLNEPRTIAPQYILFHINIGFGWQVALSIVIDYGWYTALGKWLSKRPMRIMEMLMQGLANFKLLWNPPYH
jgi:hypothetical protein